MTAELLMLFGGAAAFAITLYWVRRRELREPAQRVACELERRLEMLSRAMAARARRPAANGPCGSPGGWPSPT